MELKKIKEFLQNYIDTLISPRVNKQRDEMGFPQITFTVNEVMKGSYQPPVFHVFLDTLPELKKDKFLKPHAVIMMNSVEKDIADFLKMFSIENKVKVHWNKRPLFKNDSLHSEN